MLPLRASRLYCTVGATDTKPCKSDFGLIQPEGAQRDQPGLHLARRQAAREQGASTDADREERVRNRSHAVGQAELVARVDEDVLTEQARESGKPDAVIEKMIVGRMQKFYKEVVLVEQPFIMDPDKTVGEFLKEQGATLKGFVHFKLGEGVEKAADNFADEVAALTKGA